jgi:hypothetical protein
MLVTLDWLAADDACKVKPRTRRRRQRSGNLRDLGLVGQD